MYTDDYKQEEFVDLTKLLNEEQTKKNIKNVKNVKNVELYLKHMYKRILRIILCSF